MVIPFSLDGRQPCFNKTTGEYELVQPDLYTRRINETILGKALDAAVVYWLSGDEDYARFASDI